MLGPATAAEATAVDFKKERRESLAFEIFINEGLGTANGGFFVDWKFNLSDVRPSRKLENESRDRMLIHCVTPLGFGQMGDGGASLGNDHDHDQELLQILPESFR